GASTANGSAVIFYAAKTTQDMYVKIVKIGGTNTRSKGTEAATFYMRAGHSHTIYLAPGNYSVRIASGSGDSWYGESELFGEETGYFIGSEVLNVEMNYEYSYTLQTTSGSGSNTADKSYF
ncbi:MAG: hypothetical protein LBS21_04950, partial [Clostridiales bacterium]|nr:hypothetical protein [Clostridiales bacterium]